MTTVSLANFIIALFLIGIANLSLLFACISNKYSFYQLKDTVLEEKTTHFLALNLISLLAMFKTTMKTIL